MWEFTHTCNPTLLPLFNISFLRISPLIRVHNCTEGRGKLREEDRLRNNNNNNYNKKKMSNKNNNNNNTDHIPHMTFFVRS